MPVDITAQGVEVGKKVVETAGVLGQQADLASRAAQARYELFLLARCIAADQRIHARLPAGHVPIELGHRQVAVVPNLQGAVDRAKVPQDQQVHAIGFVPRHRQGLPVIERQHLAVIGHQQFDPGIIVDKQRAVAAVDVFQRRLGSFAQAWRGDAQGEGHRMSPCDAQLCGPQGGQHIKTFPAPILDRQHSVIANPLDASGGDN